MNSFTILSGRFQQAIGPNHIPWPDRWHHRNHFSRAAIRWPTALAVIVVGAAKHPLGSAPAEKDGEHDQGDGGCGRDAVDDDDGAGEVPLRRDGHHLG
jgi:hypothetical protein